MHKTLLTGLIAVLLFTSFSCRKVFNRPEDRLEGNWWLQRVERNAFLDWNTISTGYENGSYTFSSNGDATYKDAIGTMTGRWDMYTIRDGYYDDHGDWQTRNRTVFKVNLHNFADNRVIDWFFEDCDFKGDNRFNAEYRTPSYKYRYRFIRQ